jgi:hypothetical protein
MLFLLGIFGWLKYFLKNFQEKCQFLRLIFLRELLVEKIIKTEEEKIVRIIIFSPSDAGLWIIFKKGTVLLCLLFCNVKITLSPN